MWHCFHEIVQPNWVRWTKLYSILNYWPVMVENLLCGNCNTIWKENGVCLQQKKLPAHRIQTIFLKNILIEWFMQSIPFNSIHKWNGNALRAYMLMLNHFSLLRWYEHWAANVFIPHYITYSWYRCRHIELNFIEYTKN